MPKIRPVKDSLLNVANGEAKVYRKPRKKTYAFEEGVIRLNERDFNRWKAAYPYVGLQAELISLAPWAAKQGKNWFYAVSGALRKKNDKLALAFREAEVRARYSGENPGSRVIMQGQG